MRVWSGAPELTRILFYSDFSPGISDVVDEKYLSLLTGTKYRIGYIPSASDRSRRYFAKVRDHYKALGVTNLTYFDLGEEYDHDATSRILDCDAIHLSGGDPFNFLAMIKSRKFGDRLKSYIRNGGLLVGVSAGAMILTRTLALANESHDFAETGAVVSALKFVDFEFYPHFKGDTKTVKALQSYANAKKISFYACDDDAGLVVMNGKLETLGSVTLFTQQTH